MLAWHRRKRTTFAVIFLVLLLPPLVVVLTVDSTYWRLLAAFLGGAFLGMGMYAWDSPPEHIDRWRRGAEGERQTAKALRALTRDPEWTVVHDLPGRYGNRDHVVAGPTGVYLLDTKSVMGPASLEMGALTVRATDEPRDTYSLLGLAKAMRGAAAGLSDELSKASRERVWVQPVCVIWPEVEGGPIEQDRVWYISGRDIAEWLSGGPRRERPGTPAISAALTAHTKP
jgi:nuclease-like protein